VKQFDIYKSPVSPVIPCALCGEAFDSSRVARITQSQTQY